MKMMKKVLALSTAATMVFGMAMTTWAAPEPVTDITSDITITGLSSGVPTDISMYQFASLQYDETTNEYSWAIDTWATDYVELNGEGTAYEIKDGEIEGTSVEVLFKRAAQTQVADRSDTEDGTQHTFYDVPIGGYVIIPADESADYEPLFVVNTYDRVSSPTDGKPVAIDVTAAAKSEGHTIVKEQSDDFQQIGDTVSYTVRVTFPMMTNSAGETLEQFTITDTPFGLEIDVKSVEVELGGTDVTTQITKTVDDGVLTVDLSALIADANVGKDVVITYDATVTDTDYNNTVTAASDTTIYSPGTTEGENGSVQITKVDAENNSTVLTGVEFQIYDLGVDGVWDAKNPGTPMSLIYDSVLGAYRPVVGDESGTTTIIDGTNGDGMADGVIKVVGLDEGNYHFVETKAPNGYSINETGLTVTINPNAETPAIDVAENFLDTKLSSLPSTGGIGTTIFTIGGCAIMIAAASLFFVSRRKSESK